MSWPFPPDFSNSLQYCMLYCSHPFDWRQLYWGFWLPFIWLFLPSRSCLDCRHFEEGTTFHHVPLSVCHNRMLPPDRYPAAATVQIKCSSRNRNTHLSTVATWRNSWKYGQDVPNPSLGEPQDTITDARTFFLLHCAKESLIHKAPVRDEERENEMKCLWLLCK